MYLCACARYDETCPASQSTQSSADFRRCPLILEVSCITNLQPGTWITPGSFAVGFGCASQRCAGGGPPSLQRLSEFFPARPSKFQGPVARACAPRMAAQRLFLVCSARLNTGSSSGNSGLAAKASSPPSPDKTSPGPFI